MSAVVSKNLYELLGNDHDEDSDKEPEPPVKVIDKTPARNTKRNAPAEAPASRAPANEGGRGGGRGGRGGFSGNEGAFRDRNAGSANNHTKSTEEGGRPQRAEGTYDGRGRGRGGRGAGTRNERHSRGVGGASEKQANHGWGANEGNAELADEQAGDAIAKDESKEALTSFGGENEIAEPAAAEPEAEAEPEDNSMSYADYLAQQAEKKLSLGDIEIRKPNEGSKQDKKWANAKAIAKEDEEDFVAGTGGKAKRERERKQKVTVDIDQRYVEPAEQRGGRGGGSGGFRGGRGRGDGPPRGGRGDFRGRGGDRGARRGDGQGRGRGGAGGPRGGHAGGASAPINTDDTSAFPSLGS